MDEEESKESEQEAHFYDVEKYKRMVDAQDYAPRPTGPRLLLIRLESTLDSFGGLISSFLGMFTVFAAPLIVVVGALYGLLGFVVSFLGVISVLGWYVERKVGKSIRVEDGSIGKKLLGQVVASGLVLAIFYVLFVVVLKIKLA